MRIPGQVRGYDAEIAILRRFSKRLWVKLRKLFLELQSRRRRNEENRRWHLSQSY